jgi:endonuclease/exonuclease/phosphatase family metal-dependent hydrolase
VSSFAASLGLALLFGACQDAPTAATRSSISAAARTDLPAQAQRRLGIMTYNLYLGADLTPVIGAPPSLTIPAAAAAWAHVQATDFRIRAEAIARAIAAKHPHLVGLEEVSLWETGSSPAGPFTTSYDFLQILLDELAKKGTPYKAVAINPHFTAMLPISTSFNSFVRWTEHNAIIARADLDEETFSVSNPVSVVFQARIPLTILGQPLPITRGYATVDVKFRGKSVRFAVAHLEAYSPLVRQAQASELATALSSSPNDQIIAGDLNSLRTAGGDSWQILTSAGYTDVWSETMPGVNGFTSTFGDDLVGPLSGLDHTVDYVLRRSVPTLAGIPDEGEVVGDAIADQTANGWWPSDHAGVYVVVRIVKD